MNTTNPHTSSGMLTGRRWLTTYGLPAAVVLLAFALDLHNLEGKSLWFDELGTLADSGWGGSWWDAVRYPLTIPATPKPPLYFVLTRLFLEAGDHVFVLRLPAVLFGTLTVAAVFALGRAWIDERIGLVAAFLLAIAPLQVRYAQEARMYSLLTLLCTLSLLLFWRAIHARDGRWWAGFAVVTIMALYTHLLALLSLLVLGLWAGWLVLRPGSNRYRFRGWHLAAAMVAIALAYAPMVSYLMRGLGGPEGLGSGAAPRWTVAQLPDALRLFSGGNDLGVAVYLLLFLIGVGWMAINSRETLVLSALWILLPAIAVLSPPFGHQVFIRYFLVGLPVYVLVVATGLTRAIQWACVHLAGPRAQGRRHSVATVLVVGAVAGVLIGISWPSIASYYAEGKQNWRDATWLVQDLARPGDKVFVRHLYHQAGVRFYATQRNQGLDLAKGGTVLLIPTDPATPFPLGEGEAGWLIVPDQEDFQPGGELAQVLPNHTLLKSTVFKPANKPKDSRMIAPISFRTVAVVPVVPARPASIRFWADREQLAAGDCTWLRWEADNVRELYLDGEGVVGHDARQVCPTAATAYRLEAVLLDGGRTSATVQIGVDAP